MPKTPILGEVTSFFPKTCYEVVKLLCQKYDYGRVENQKKYGSTTVPLYPLEKLMEFDVPKYLFRGEFDYLADQKDYLNLLNYLPKESTKSEV